MTPKETSSKRSITSMEHLKKRLREHYREILAKIPPERRDFAEKEGVKALLEETKSAATVLSFSPFSHEIELSSFNQSLLENGKLVLPRIEGDELALYFVGDLATLIPNRWKIKEPNPSLCKKCPLEKISIALIPALAFDRQNHRLGHGGGYYDRLLARFPAEIKTIGVGFLEQLEPDLPKDSWDRVLSAVRLF